MSAFAQAIVNTGDTLQLAIKGVPMEEQGQINGEYPVSSAGKIYLPYLSENPITATGLTTAALARKIESAYKAAEIYTTPTISIQSLNEAKREDLKVTQAIQKFVNVSGQVSRPGQQPHRPNLTLIEVVSQAGPTTFAALRRVELLRNKKIYKYDMDIPAHMRVKVYPYDQITVQEKNWRGQ
jgi:polysaccharide export outer membrane protein